MKLSKLPMVTSAGPVIPFILHSWVFSFTLVLYFIFFSLNKLPTFFIFTKLFLRSCIYNQDAVFMSTGLFQRDVSFTMLLYSLTYLQSPFSISLYLFSYHLTHTSANQELT